jgi:4-amino-4-deoxy-L-arabinose transferase-like glycosyltransferase
VNQPTPAIVAQNAVRRLPRVALLLFCLAYALPGFFGRAPWKNADIAAFGYMDALASGSMSWLAPRLLGQPPEFDGLLPYWLGAWAMQLAPAWVAPDFAARIPFMLLLGVAMAATWYSVYFLARSPQAQPVAFAFGGEASPADYARAIADGGLLALIATLGLAQLSHETTPALAQLGFTALTMFGMASMPYRTVLPGLAVLAGLAGLSLSGAPWMALSFAVGGSVATVLDRSSDAAARERRWQSAGLIAAAAAIAALLAWSLELWHWRIGMGTVARDWPGLARFLVWFAWPATPLAVWTLWRWRRQLGSRHLALPLWFVVVALVAALLTPTSDRALLLGLPALATLAAFALPTLRRSVAALIDWFTLLFFSGCALVIWVVWLAMQTGVPAQPAANVARLAPGFVPSFSIPSLAAALLATLAWGWLVKWRAGRHRAVIWKSLVLPAGGAALCWLLLMTLWLPLLDYARSYAPQVRNVVALIDAPGCVEVHRLSQAQMAALRYHGKLTLRRAGIQASCPWLLVDADEEQSASIEVDLRQWQPVATVARPTDSNDNMVLYRRAER